VDITCVRCRRSYFVPDDLVHGRVFRARCSHCQHSFSVDVPERPGKKGARPPKDDLKPTAASAIPGLAEELEDGLGWLEEKAKEVEEDEYVLLTVRRQRRLGGAAIVAGAAVLLLAAGGVGAWIAMRPRPDAPSRRAQAGAEAGSAPVADVSGLAWQKPAEPEPAPVPAVAAAPAPAPEPAQRAKRPKLGVRDAQLLDLLQKKQDIAVLPAAEDEEASANANAKSALDPAAAEKVVAANRRAFDTCVSRALRLNPSLKLARRATLVVTVQPSGTVSRAYLAEEEVDRTDLGACLAETARRMVFPSFDGEPVDVAMPLSLSAVF
jgi:hypothetical protein